jgi:type I restriction enzyme R subunit
MTVDVSERNFEEAVEAVLTAPVDQRETPSDTEFAPGGYRRRLPDDYDRSLCLIPDDVFQFLYATQPREWEKFKKQVGGDAKNRLLQRLASEIQKRGTLDVLRKGIKSDGSSFRLAYFRPSSGLNAEVQKLYEANLFSSVRQLKFSEKTEQSLDMTLFLNGLPIFTAELKNPLMSQDVRDAMRQYKATRDPREPLFTFGRCLAHFAVDPDLVYMTTHLQGTRTVFLPFNQGRNGGAGNPVAWKGFASAYLWESVWSRDSVLDLVQSFIQAVEEEDDKGRKTGRRALVFPRYHQLDAVRRLVRDAKERGAGQHYLVQHSAGSGKSNSIAWLAHQLSVLHDASDRRVVDSIVVVTDRKVLDRQLQRTVRQFELTDGVVENIDKTSRQLKQALEDGKTIIVTTLQKFPVIADQMVELGDKRFAVIIDEAHSSQSGESTKALKSVLAMESLEEAEREDGQEEEDIEDLVVAEMKRRGRLPNVSHFAFTATPKAKTLEIFGTKQDDGSFKVFSIYSMRQAIEEGFILDVLENYTTFKTYWSLLKKVEGDPRYEKKEATYLLKSWVDLHEHAIETKVEIMLDHFAEHVTSRIGGRAKAMIVTRSRKHAVRFKLAVDKRIREKGFAFKALVAFSGTVRDGGADLTETGMNGFPESQTAEAFKADENRILVVANKFQTGFDQPLLHTMYVDKKLGGVNAVQTLSRLNRLYPGKNETMVLDFANEAEEVRKAFQPYYDRTILTEGTDPNLLYDLESRLAGFHVFSPADVEKFAATYFDPKGTQDKLHACLEAPIDRFRALAEEEQATFRGQLQDYVRLYAFLSQILTFADADLEKLYVFGRFLLRKLPGPGGTLPIEIRQQIDMESYRVRQTSAGKITLERGLGELQPINKGSLVPTPDEMEALSRILKELNERFGTDFTDEDRVFIEQLEAQLVGDEALAASIRVNTPENARLTFDHVVNDRLQEMINSNFKFYKQITDDPDFAGQFLGWLFERYRKHAKLERGAAT